MKQLTLLTLSRDTFTRHLDADAALLIIFRILDSLGENSTGSVLRRGLFVGGLCLICLGSDEATVLPRLENFDGGLRDIDINRSQGSSERCAQRRKIKLSKLFTRRLYYHLPYLMAHDTRNDTVCT